MRAKDVPDTSWPKTEDLPDVAHAPQGHGRGGRETRIRARVGGSMPARGGALQRGRAVPLKPWWHRAERSIGGWRRGLLATVCSCSPARPRPLAPIALPPRAPTRTRTRPRTRSRTRTRPARNAGRCGGPLRCDRGHESSSCPRRRPASHDGRWSRRFGRSASPLVLRSSTPGCPRVARRRRR